jgi:hypothetical protein
MRGKLYAACFLERKIAAENEVENAFSYKAKARPTDVSNYSKAIGKLRSNKHSFTFCNLWRIYTDQ